MGVKLDSYCLEYTFITLLWACMYYITGAGTSSKLTRVYIYYNDFYVLTKARCAFMYYITKGKTFTISCMCHIALSMDIWRCLVYVFFMSHFVYKTCRFFLFFIFTFIFLFQLSVDYMMVVRLINWGGGLKRRLRLSKFAYKIGTVYGEDQLKTSKYVAWKTNTVSITRWGLSRL